MLLRGVGGASGGGALSIVVAVALLAGRGGPSAGQLAGLHGVPVVAQTVFALGRE